MRSVVQAWSGLCEVESLKLEGKPVRGICRLESCAQGGSFGLIVRAKHGPGLIRSAAQAARKRQQQPRPKRAQFCTGIGSTAPGFSKSTSLHLQHLGSFNRNACFFQQKCLVLPPSLEADKAQICLEHNGQPSILPATNSHTCACMCCCDPSTPALNTCSLSPANCRGSDVFASKMTLGSVPFFLC